MQKCAVLPGKMQKSGAELGKLKVHVAVVKSIKIAVIEISNITEYKKLIIKKYGKKHKNVGVLLAKL